ncbi:hypothetical protein S83_023580, partial [Arachis hypogaea]
MTAMEISVSFIFRLLYYISGLDAVINNIMKMLNELIQSSKVNFVMPAIDALDGLNHLGFFVSSNLYFLKDHDEIARVHFLIALGKPVKNGHDGFLAVQSGIAYLKRILHIFPNCSLIRWESLLHMGRRIIVVGDLNIAPSAIDRCDAGPEFDNNEFRRWFRSILTQYKRAKPESILSAHRWKGGQSIKLEGSDHAPILMTLVDIPDVSLH